MPQEYTPEMSKSYLDSLMTGIDDMGRVDEGRASAEAASRGMLDQGAFMGSATGQVRKGVADAKSRTIGAFNLDVANKTREERLGKENRGYQVEDRDFGAVEAQKNRDFQTEMARIGYDFQREQDEFDPGGFVAGIAGSALSAGVGGYMGGKGYKAGRG